MSRLKFKDFEDKVYDWTRPPTIRWNKSDRTFTFNTLDSLDGTYVNYKISEEDLKRLIEVDKYGDDEKAEMYYKGRLREVEQQELDDDTYGSISVCQWFYHVSLRTLKLAQRKAHLYRLGKETSPVLKLKPHQFHSNGGRKAGSKNKVDTERLEYLRDNYDMIEANCIKHNWPDEWIEMNRELGNKKTYDDFLALKK